MALSEKFPQSPAPSPRESEWVGRRAFLTVTAAAAVGVGARRAVGKSEAEPAGDPADVARTGYRETDHIRRYYSLSRF